MVDKNTAKLLKEKINGVSEYLKGLQWFPGNAALKWVAESCEKTADAIEDKKKAVKNIKEITEYMESLHWFKGNSALEYAHTELTESLIIVEGDKSPSEPEPEPEIEEVKDPSMEVLDDAFEKSDAEASIKPIEEEE